MRLQSLLVALVTALVVLMTAGAAQADLVLLLPAKGQVPGSMLSSILDNETRYAVIEVGHKLVEQKELEGAQRQVADGQPDSYDEYLAMAKFAKSDWVVIPTVFQQEKSWRLEVIAFQTQSGRTETVARDIDTEHVHVQIVEMLKVLLRPQGVGTEALPWESGLAARPISTAGPTKPTEPPKTSTSPDGAKRPLFFLGAGLGVNGAVARPSDATGGATSLLIGGKLGVSPVEPLDIAVNVAGNVAGPRALMLDLSFRYLFPVTPAVRLGGEVGPGLFAAQGGSKDKAFLLRATAVVALKISPSFGLEAQLGDLRYVAQSDTLVLAGAQVQGVLRF